MSQLKTKSQMNGVNQFYKLIIKNVKEEEVYEKESWKSKSDKE